MVKLGDKVKDEVSGFVGIAVAKHIYRYGCVRITVQPSIDKEGKLPETQPFDEPQLKVLKSKKVIRKKGDKPGGPMPYKDNPKITPKRNIY